MFFAIMEQRKIIFSKIFWKRCLLFSIPSKFKQYKAFSIDSMCKQSNTDFKHKYFHSLNVDPFWKMCCLANSSRHFGVRATLPISFSTIVLPVPEVV